MTEEQARLFSAAFDEYYPEVLAYCRRRMGNVTDGGDAAADTFLVAWRRIDDFVAVQYPRAWLYGVARRTTLNLMRSKRRASNLADKVEHLAPVAAPDAAEEAIGAADVAAALAALAQLSESDQEIIALAAFDSFGHEEIAVALGITAGQARSRLYRARQRLRAKFADRDAT